MTVYCSVRCRRENSSEEDLPNLYFIRMDARNLPDVFEKGEVDKIYLNFSDPWPKERHAKRRLTSRWFWTLRQDSGTGGNGRVQDR